MARGSSAASPQSPTFAIFVDTNLDTHLAVVASADDTVGDLKKKIRVEHFLCFPKIGEINVQSMKVRRRGSFYHLSDSMLIKSAFVGTKGTWFLYMDAISASHQAEIAENALNQNREQLQKLRLDKEPNVRTIGGAATRLQGLLMNGSSDGKNLILKDTGCVLEKQPLLDIGMQMLSASDNSSLKHAGSHDDHIVPDDGNVPNHVTLNVKDLHDGCNRPLCEHEKKSACYIPEVEELIYDEVEVRLHHQPETDQIVDQGEKDAGEDDHGNLSVTANDEFLSVKKEKSRKRINACRDDGLLEKNGPLRNKTECKKGEDDPPEDPVANVGSCAHSKEALLLKTVHPVTSSQMKHKSDPVSPEKLCIEQLHDSSPLKDLMKDEKKRKKKRRKGASDFVDNIVPAIPETGPSHTSLNKSGALVSPGEQVPEENPDQVIINNNQNVDKESHETLLTDKATRDVTYADCVESDTRCPLSTNLNGDTLTQSRLSYNQSCDDYPIQEHVTGAEPEGQLDGNHTCLAKEAVVNVQGAALHGNPAEVDSDVPTISQFIKKSKNGSSRKTSSKHNFLHSSADHATIGNLEKTSGNQNKKMNKKSDLVSSVEEPVDHRSSADGDSEVPCDANVGGVPHRRRKKSKKTVLCPPFNTSEALNLSGDQVTEDNPKGISDDHYKDPIKGTKGSTVIVEAANLGNPTEHDSAIPSNPKVQSTHCRRKKSSKAKLPDNGTIQKDSVHSLVKEAPGENFKEILNNHEEEGTDCKGPVPAEKVALPGNLSVEKCTDPGNPNERNIQHRRKKSAKAELANHESIGKKPEKEATDKNTKGITEDNHKELCEEPKTTASLREAIHIENPAEKNSVIPLDTKVRSSPRHKRKRDKTENFEKSLGTAQIDRVNESSTGTNPDGKIHDLVSSKDSNVDPTGLPDESSNKHDFHFAQTVNEEYTKGLLAKTNENSGKKADHNVTEDPIEENSYMELPKSDSEKVNFIEFFVPKIFQLESHASEQELLSIETGARNKKKLKRKRSKMHSEDSTADLMGQPNLHEQDKPKKNPRDGNPVCRGLADPAVQLLGKEPNSAREINEETRRSKSDLPLSDNSSELGSIRSSRDKKKLEKKPQSYTSDIDDQVPVLKVEQTNHLKGNSSLSERKLESISRNKGENIMEPTHGNQQSMNFDTSVDSIAGGRPLIHNHSSASTEISLKEGIADLAASSDSTEEDTPSRQYRVAVRKAPRSKYRNNLSDTNPEKTLLAPTGAIFNDAISGSSEDEFQIYDRKATSRALSDTSSTSTDSDGDLEETRRLTSLKPHAYMSSQEVDSAIHGKPDEPKGGIVLSQSSNVAKKGKRMSDIFRSSSSYRKAKLRASQFQMEDSESQPVDVVLETQPELA